MTTSVAIIGGGAVGLSAAWQLVERGVTDVTVLEAGDLAAGSSSRSAGFETQYVDPLDIELQALSMLEFRRLQIGAELEVKEIGYLRLAPDGDALDAFEASVRLQRAFGIDDSAVLSADDVRELVPGLRGPAIAGGLWGPHDGRIDGPDYCRILAGSAVARGAKIRTGERVIEASSRASGWRLQTTNGVIECDGRQRRGSVGGADRRTARRPRPGHPLRNQIGIWRLTQPLDRALPMVMDYIPHTGTRGLYVATYDDAEHVLAGLHSEEIDDAGVDPDAYDREADPSTSPTRGRPWNAAYRSCRLATSNELGPGSTWSARTGSRSSARRLVSRT